MPENPLVSIVCIAYNQEKFVGQALRSFLQQETDFAWEVIVNDDASPDGTAEVIRSFEPEFGGRLHALYQKQNQWSQGVHPWFDVTFPLVRGKYIAICEGDDYWCDPKKLQKQVDFLEAHPDHGAIHSDYLEYHEESGHFLHPKRDALKKNGDIFRAMLEANTNYLVTGSLVLRTDLVHEAIAAIREMPKFAMGDFPLVLHIASRAKIAYLDEVTCVYRVLKESASHSEDIEKIIIFKRSTQTLIETFASGLSDRDGIVLNARRCFQESLLMDCLRYPRIVATHLHQLKAQNFKGEWLLKYFLCRLLNGGAFADVFGILIRNLDARRLRKFKKENNVSPPCSVS